MNELDILRFLDEIYKFFEVTSTYTLPATFCIAIIFVWRPGFTPYFTDHRRATADFRWVAMSLLSLALLLWISDYRTKAALAAVAAVKQATMLENLGHNGFLFNAEWCTPPFYAPDRMTKKVDLDLYCQANSDIHAQTVAFANIINENRYEWHNAPLFEFNETLLKFEAGNLTDVEIVEKFVFKIIKLANEFNKISYTFRNETPSYRTYVQLEILRYILLHLMLLFGAIRLMRAYSDIKKASKQHIA